MYVPTNHVYVGDIFLLGRADIIKPNLSVREGLGASLLFSLLNLEARVIEGWSSSLWELQANDKSAFQDHCCIASLHAGLHDGPSDLVDTC